MNSDPENSIREVFLRAVEIDDAQTRDRYLERVCADDASMLEKVRQLIAAEEEAGISEEISGSGERIGPYKLLQQIGEGGFGVVYMAEQLEPVHRRVALKIIKLGMDTRQVIARFEAERQALAMMDHPNIARVLDAGATESGRPFFVMELVRGIRITDYCDRRNLDTRARLRTFTRVCHAVQHAHQKGIIHRDLKPSNILVTEVDSAPTPKIIDFGIAKAIEGRLSDKTLFTAFEQLMGTPAYMSPEQATQTTADIDTRTDIYSLGVLLYELLTGQTPFDGKALLESGVDVLRRTIQETEPQRPSTRLGELKAERFTAIARCRDTEPMKLASLIKGDLDWIVMKCLEKDRRRRYGSAETLAADVERHLESQPVQARPPSLLYSLQRSFRRNRLAFGAIAAVVLSLVAGLIATFWQFREKDWALSRALAAEQEQVRLREEADAANERSRSDLRQSLIHQAHLETLTGTVGRRDSAVAALARAASINPSSDMVETAISALSMFQVRDLGVVIARDGHQFNVAVHPGTGRYLWHGREGTSFAVRQHPGGDALCDITSQTADIIDQYRWLTDGGKALIRWRSGPLQLWSLETCQAQWSRPVSQFELGSQGFFVGRVGASLDGDHLAHIDQGSQLEIIDAADGRRLALVQSDSPISAVGFHPWEDWIAVGTGRGVQVVDWRKPLTLFQRDTGRGCTGLSWSPDGQVIAHSGWAYKLELWNVVGDPSPVSVGLGGYRTTPCYSRDGEWLAGSDSRGGLTLWNGRSGSIEVDSLSGFPICFSEDGSRLYRESGEEGVAAYELSGSECYSELSVPFFADSSLPGLAISPDERWVAATSYSSGIYIWDLQNGGAPVDTFALRASSAMFDASGTHLLSCGEDGVRIWEFVGSESGVDLGNSVLLPGATGSSRYLTHTYGDERRIVISTKPCVYSIQRDNFSLVERYPSRDQQSAAISPDGRWLVESSHYSPIYRYDLTADRSAEEISPQGGLVSFSPDGRVLTAGRAGMVEAWDTRSWQRAWRIATKTVKQTTGLCVFRPQGDILATLDDSETIVILDPSTGRTMVRLVSPKPGPINRIAFSDTGRILLVSTEEGRIQVWRLDALEEQLMSIGLDWGRLNGMPRIARSD